MSEFSRGAPYEYEGFTLGVQDIPDWFMDRVSTDEIRIYGVRGFLTYAVFDQGERPAVQRVRGDWIERRWLEAVVRPAEPALPGEVE